ncbi:MAG: polysaccharide deacetylase [Albidovulum sp.]|nr:polysaccharide deacetylase [Albidovulum sp.]
MITNPPPWPNGARCAVAITFDMDADSLIHLDHKADGINRISGLSMLRYGPEISIPRILDTYRRLGIKQTFFIPAWCIENYPRAIDAILEAGHEIGHHGYIHENPRAAGRDEEEYWLYRGIDVIKKATGKKPRGWRAPLYNFSYFSADLLIKAGFRYDASLMGDDVPYILQTNEGEIVELPSHWGMDDWPQYVHAMDLDYLMPISSASRGMDVFREEFEAMWEHRGLWIAVWHPFATGRLARWRQAERLFQHMLEKGGVWFARLEDIAAHIQSCRSSGEYTARVDTLPYYDKPELPTKSPEI